MWLLCNLLYSPIWCDAPNNLDSLQFVRYFSLFVFFEQSKFPNMEEPIIPQVLANFNKITGLKARWRPFKKADALSHSGADGLLLFSRNGNTTEMVAEWKTNVLSIHLPLLIAFKKENEDIVVLANTISPGMRTELHQLGINYIDGAGNTFINHDPVFVWIEGRKDTRQPQLKGKPFSKKGLRIIFSYSYAKNTSMQPSGR